MSGACIVGVDGYNRGGHVACTLWSQASRSALHALLPRRAGDTPRALPSPTPRLCPRSRLAAENRRLGALSPGEAEAVCGGTAEYVRAYQRLLQLLELGHRMGLLSTGACPVLGAAWAAPGGCMGGPKRTRAAMPSLTAAVLSPLPPPLPCACSAACGRRRRGRRLLLHLRCVC